ncbi:TIGR02099 family protein [Undibacterium sp. CY7W]|uniref:TIGR02099 family protein n=1 Tax=Undibacterium rugosum TaxID=2762291 RepID=A0A923I6G6_9BURK|nr:YhdP family protein [Undibacterium rugosum]MBC3936476.1 TIGR02099 family protein [Undibacterium rugosum]
MTKESASPAPTRRSRHLLSSLRMLVALPCRRLWRAGGCGLRAVCWGLLGLYFVFSLLVLVLRYVLLPQVGSYQTEVETALTASIGRPVKIASLEASWQGLHPQFALHQVQLFDQHGQLALALPEVRTTLSWWSLPLAELRFRRIELVAPELTIQRDERGQLYIGGFLLDTQRQGDGKGLDWVLAQQQIRIRGGKLHWRDQTRGTPGANLSGVNFDLNNHWQQHQFSLLAQMNEGLAQPLDVRGNLRHASFAKTLLNRSVWSGEIYAFLSQADLPALQAYLPLNSQLQQGKGTLRAWMQLDAGRMADLTLDVLLRQVQGKFAKDLPALDMQEIRGRITASEKISFARKYLPSVFGPAGHTLALTDFSMTARDGLRLPPTSIRESFTPGSDGQSEQVELSSPMLDLQTLVQFAEHLPLPAGQRQMLNDFAPKGVLKNLRAQWRGSYPEILSYQVQGQFENLSLRAQPARAAQAKRGKRPATAAVPAIPGFDNLSGSIEANEKNGKLVLNSTALALHTASYFVDPSLYFDRLFVHANWKIANDDLLTVQLQKFDAEQGNMRASFSGRHTVSLRADTDNPAGNLDLSGRIDRFDLKTIDKYIPASAPQDLRYWLTHSLLDGYADEVQVKVRGDLSHFPFAANDSRAAQAGEFRVKGSLSGAKLDFTAGQLSDTSKQALWPVIEQIRGSFVFDRARMEISGDTAKTLGVDLKKVKAIIPDLMTHGAVLQIDGTASGLLQQMLGYVAASPVQGWLGHFLDETKASGLSSLNLKLQLPLLHLIDAKVNGILQFQNNDVMLQPGIPQVSAANGKLEFNETGLTIPSLKAIALGGPLVISGGSQKDNAIRIRLDGTASAQGLISYLPPEHRRIMDGRLSGSSRYTAAVNVKKQLPEIVVESSLQGMALHFPEPLRKAATEILPLKVELTPLAGNESNQLRDELKLQLGTLAQARFLRQKQRDNDKGWRVARGGIGIGQPAPDSEQGMAWQIQLPKLNMDEWSQWLDNMSAKSAASAAVTDTGLESYFYPASLQLRAGHLHVMGKQFDDMQLALTQQKGNWKAGMKSAQMAGTLSWNEAALTQANSVITGRFDYLKIPASAAKEVTELLDGKKMQTQLPGLDIVVDQLELVNKKMGRLELQASNQLVNGRSEWQLRKINLKNPDAELKASGKWLQQADAGQTQLEYVLDIQHAGQLLNRLGFANVLQGGKGKIEGNLRWNGLPFAMDLPSMSGKMQLDLAAGQFLKVDPGAAKLLGVLSMQSLPRRLTLDFRDVFSEGFAFDGINGHAVIEKGLAHTENLKMRGLNATVLMAGKADIVHETQDLHVVVIPVVNAGAASVVYGLAVNPVIGLGTFLAQLFLREPLAKAFTFEYGLTGSWTEPVVKKLEVGLSHSASSAETSKTGRGE